MVVETSGADASLAAVGIADGVVHVVAVEAAAFVVVEEGRQDALGQGGGEEKGIIEQGAGDDFPQAGDGRRAFGQLQVLLALGRLDAGGSEAVLPLGVGENVAALGHLVPGQQFRNMQHHDAGLLGDGLGPGETKNPPGGPGGEMTLRTCSWP